jgi:hypothetical protein
MERSSDDVPFVVHPPSYWQVEVELRRGTEVRHVWVDDVGGVEVGAELGIEDESDWWRVARRSGRRRVTPVAGFG